MKERSIIMSGDNPRLILEGRKTQARRLVKNPNFSVVNGRPHFAKADGSFYDCPYGIAGDRLWVREAWHTDNPEYIARYKAEPYLGDPDPDNAQICYRADLVHENSGCVWRPSIHMPRWASRITLEITKVRVERLQDISEEDALAEGQPCNDRTARSNYMILWDSLHGKGAWNNNPFVWVIEFSRV